LKGNKYMKNEIIDLELTKEMKLALGACHAIDIKKKFLYTPHNFRKTSEDGNFIIPKEAWTVFELRPLSGIEQQQIKDSCTSNLTDALTGETKIEFRDGLFKMKCLKVAVKKWNFLFDQDFKRFASWKPSFIKDDMLTDEALSMISPYIQEDLWTAIFLNLTLSEAELLGLNV
jgi:hypothetical protein